MAWLFKIICYAAIGAGVAWLLEAFGISYGAVAGLAAVVAFLYLDNKMDEIRGRIAVLERDWQNDR